MAQSKNQKEIEKDLMKDEKDVKKVEKFIKKDGKDPKKDVKTVKIVEQDLKKEEKVLKKDDKEQSLNNEGGMQDKKLESQSFDANEMKKQQMENESQFQVSSFSAYQKQNCQNLTSGLSSVVTSIKQDNIMMEAVVIAKQQEDQKKDLENRIVRLQMEEQRANKRIKELQRKQKFVKQINDDKAERIATKADMKQDRQRTEDKNRLKFNGDRQFAKTMMDQTLQRTFQSNRGQYNNVKTQQNQINEMLNENNIMNNNEKRMSFQKVKNTQVRAKQNYLRKSYENKSSLKNDYEVRVKEKLDYANETQHQAKLKEELEAKLLNRRQRTQLTVEKMTDQLNKTQDKSPVKQKLLLSQKKLVIAVDQQKQGMQQPASDQQYNNQAGNAGD